MDENGDQEKIEGLNGKTSRNSERLLSQTLIEKDINNVLQSVCENGKYDPTLSSWNFKDHIDL